MSTASRIGGKGLKNEDFLFFWVALKEALAPACSGLVEVRNEPGYWAVDTPSGRPFLKLRIQKKHVGLYLLPLYYHPGALDPALRPHLNGKVTLRFSDPQLVPTEALARQAETCLALVGLY